MGKSMVSIHRELEKEAYKKTPLGIVEGRIAVAYKELQEKGIAPTHAVALKINKIRKDNEDAQLAYIDKTNREHKIAVDKMLLKSMSAELKVLESFLKG